ncbi:MAG: glycosyltransferase family 2 protein [Candidatus Omnitrophica bacterium]|nr:glycosyltransferase family 2 protein [Candidatus Omnitrophota bacterium]
MENKVCVIIPTCGDREKKLRRALYSVLQQSYKNFEVIVVDNRNSEVTEKLVQDFNDNRIKYIKFTEVRGPSAARNAGLRAAGCDYVAFLDDDDEWLPDKLELQMEKFKKFSGNGLGIVYTGYASVDENNGRLRHLSLPSRKGKVFSDLLKSCFAITSSLIVKRSVFEEVGLYDESLKFWEDGEFLLRAATKFDFDYVNKVLVKHHIHGTQLSYDVVSQIEGIKRVLDKHNEEFLKYKEVLSNHLYHLGYLYVLNKNYKEARRLFFGSFKTKKTNLRSLLHMILSFLTPGFHESLLEKRRYIG